MPRLTKIKTNRASVSEDVMAAATKAVTKGTSVREAARHTKIIAILQKGSMTDWPPERNTFMAIVLSVINSKSLVKKWKMIS